jgi:hypothetical protein
MTRKRAPIARIGSRLGKESPEAGGADVAEDGAGAARENRRHPDSLHAESRMPNRINTAMNAVKPRCLDAPRAAALMDSGALELLERDHAVLTRRNSGNEGVRIGVGAFPSHVGR